MANAYNLNRSDLSYFSTNSTSKDGSFVNEALVGSLCKDVGYDLIYGDKKSDKYKTIHMSKKIGEKEERVVLWVMAADLSVFSTDAKLINGWVKFFFRKKWNCLWKYKCWKNSSSW